MRIQSILTIIPLLALSLSPLNAKQSRALDLLSSLTGYAPVAFTYNCPKTTGTLPTCTTSFAVPQGKILVIQSVSGSATPLNPTATGTFPNGQAYLNVTTQLDGATPVPNFIGPNYALTGSNTWYFTILLALYSDEVPVVANNGGPVFIQGYVYNK